MTERDKVFEAARHHFLSDVLLRFLGRRCRCCLSSLKLHYRTGKAASDWLPLSGSDFYTALELHFERQSHLGDGSQIVRQLLVS